MKKTTRLITILFVCSLLLCSCKSVPTQSEPKEVKTEEITLVAFGDNLLHMPVVNSGKQEDGTYNYSHLFTHLQPKIKNADIAVMGQETIFGGAELGYSGYPLFNSPSDMGDSLVTEGFDVILHASNHVLDKGVRGIENTLAFWKQYPDVAILGINESVEKQSEVYIKDIKGTKIAMLNYTYGANGFMPPAGKEYLIKFINEEKIQKDATLAENNADFTVAFLHWGTEYSIIPTTAQKELAQKMCAWGVDLIIGAHPHVIEPVEWIKADNGNSCLVYYSLGNFVSRQKETRNVLGAMADVTLTVSGDTVTISDAAFVPVVTHYNSTSTEFAVYPLSEYTDDLAAAHGLRNYVGPVTIDFWKQTVEKVFDGYNMNFVRY